MILGDSIHQTKIRQQNIKKFGTTATSYNVQFKELEVVDVPDILKTLKQLFGAIIEDVTLNAKPNDMMRIAIECPTLDYPIVIPFVQVQHITADRVLSEIERVIQSNEDFVLDEELKLEITHVNMPNGGSKKTMQIREYGHVSN